MKKALILIAILAVTLCKVKIPIAMRPHKNAIATKAPVLTLDLAVEPYHRWDKIMEQYKGPVNKFMTQLIDLLPLPNSFYQKLGAFAENTKLYADYVEEIKGICNIAQCDWQKLLFANYMYDISSILPEANICTSSVAKRSNGSIVHGRNLDFGPWILFSRDSASINVVRGSEYVATFEQVMGSVFVLSGIKNNKFSISVNTRKYEVENRVRKLITNIMVYKYMPSTFLVREVLQSDMDYEQVLEKLQTTRVTAPVYYTLAGLDKGAVISKNPVGIHDIQEIGPDSEEWFIVQTNYDLLESPGLDQRKLPAQIRLSQLGQSKLNPSSFFTNIMTQYPTQNIATIYTSMFEPSQSYHKLTLWYGDVNEFYEQNPEYKQKQNLRGQIQDLIMDEIFQDQTVSDAEIMQMGEELENIFDSEFVTELN